MKFPLGTHTMLAAFLRLIAELAVAHASGKWKPDREEVVETPTGKQLVTLSKLAAWPTGIEYAQGRKADVNALREWVYEAAWGKRLRRRIAQMHKKGTPASAAEAAINAWMRQIRESIPRN